MSLITRCPACGTMFKVVPDQLRISEGWVRCGHCGEVFDASAHMQGDAAAEPAPPQPAPDVMAEQGRQPALEPEQPPMEARPAPWPEPEPEPRVAPALAVPEALQIEPYLPDDLRAERADDLVIEPAAPALAPAMEDVSFVREARRKAFWRRPVVRVLMALLALVLLLALATQLAVQERDRIAAAQPALKPVLEALCEPLHCTVNPPRQIEAIVIDSSSFSKLRGDAYRLAFTLRNQATTPVAMPAIELTLTDAQDQPVLRRVLSPADLGVASGLIEAAGDWSGSYAVSVVPGSGAGRVAGYRLLAFYP